MILIDSNALLVLILGLMDPALINKHKKTSIYDDEDFQNLLIMIEQLENVVVLPNVWTEVDNLLNGFNRDYKHLYIETLIRAIKKTTEKYLESSQVEDSYAFYDLGLTDTLILRHAKECKLLITSDSALSDFARSEGIDVYDMKEMANERFR